MSITSDEIAMTKEMLNQLDAFDWTICRWALNRSCLVIVNNKLAKFNVNTNEVYVGGDRLPSSAYFIVLDPSIDWHKDLIKMYLLEEL